MSHFLVTQTGRRAGDDAIEEMLVHSVHRKPKAELGDFGLGGGTVMDQADVASLIIAGNDVRCGLVSGPGVYVPGHRLRVRPGGPDELVESVGDDGKPSRQLLDLPRWP